MPESNGPDTPNRAAREDLILRLAASFKSYAIHSLSEGYPVGEMIATMALGLVQVAHQRPEWAAKIDACFDVEAPDGENVKAWDAAVRQWSPNPDLFISKGEEVELDMRGACTRCGVRVMNGRRNHQCATADSDPGPVPAIDR